MMNPGTKTTVLIPFAARLFRIKAETVTIPGWEEIRVVVCRPLYIQPDFTPRTTKGWQVCCAESGLSFMNGHSATTRAQAIAIAKERLDKTMRIYVDESKARERILRMYENQKQNTISAREGMKEETVS